MMKSTPLITLACPLWMVWPSLAAAGQAAALPVRGLHVFAPPKQSLPAALEFIGRTLPKEGVNTLVVEFGYNFDFHSRPEFADRWALDANDVRKLAAACRAAGIELIPQINCLGHQSWAGNNGRLLQKHPDFDETPGKYQGNKGIYCRSYCPLHPKVHELLFALIDELAAASEAKAFHVGMDEVFILADPNCPRCRGRDPAELFAGEVTRLHAHLKSTGRRMWMWGDRFIDGKATKIGQWEASTNGTHPAVDRVPKDIVICDWHYGKAHDTARYFAGKGFQVVSCPWRNADVALAQFAMIRAIRAGADKAAAGRALGVLQTTWCGFDDFVRAYKRLEGGAAPDKTPAGEAAHCFRTLFRAVRARPEARQTGKE